MQSTDTNCFSVSDAFGVLIVLRPWVVPTNNSICPQFGGVYPRIFTNFILYPLLSTNVPPLTENMLPVDHFGTPR